MVKGLSHEDELEGVNQGNVSMSNNKPSHNAARGLSDGFKVGYWLLSTDRTGDNPNGMLR